MLLLLFSLILYRYISYSIRQETILSLRAEAMQLLHKSRDPYILQRILEKRKRTSPHRKIVASLAVLKNDWLREKIKTIEDGDRTLLALYEPLNISGWYLVVRQDVSQQMAMLHNVLRAILTVNLLAMGFIVLYAFFLSQMLLSPIAYLSSKLTTMDERRLEAIGLDEMPEEFRSLGESINRLIQRISGHLQYHKELFVGIAHELKTPLAVMKTRSQLARMRKNSDMETLHGALRENEESIDRMDRMIGSMLEFGRAEGAQLDGGEIFDIVELIRSKMADFEMLAERDGKRIEAEYAIDSLFVSLPPLLVIQIVQNLVQNALRYTPKGGVLQVRLDREGDRLLFEVLDEGPGIDESIDVFAPFARQKDSPGTGLGLFLVKTAVDALGGKIRIHRRKDGSLGTIARVSIPIRKVSEG
ncbi:sensor histidine kinase [Nitratifractor sp.]